MDILRIGLAALIGTSFMTFFSYVYSIQRRKHFKEPELLNELLKLSVYSPAGWLIHYVVGLAFAVSYHLIWMYAAVNVTIGNAILLGLVSGFLGCAIWKITFKVHPNPPDIHVGEYLLQLLVAHIIFGIFAFIGYQLPIWLS